MKESLIFHIINGLKIYIRISDEYKLFSANKKITFFANFSNVLTNQIELIKHKFFSIKFIIVLRPIWHSIPDKTFLISLCVQIVYFY